VTYPHETEVARWLENWSRWSPGAYGMSQWRDAVSSSAIIRRPCPVMGGEAADTQRALDRMVRAERSALEQYHLAAAPWGRRRSAENSRRTLYALLHAAHHHFYELRWTLRDSADYGGAQRRLAAEVARTCNARRPSSTESGCGTLVSRCQRGTLDNGFKVIAHWSTIRVMLGKVVTRALPKPAACGLLHL
jgi:hypothetical protein